MRKFLFSGCVCCLALLLTADAAHAQRGFYGGRGWGGGWGGGYYGPNFSISFGRPYYDYSYGPYSYYDYNRAYYHNYYYPRNGYMYTSPSWSGDMTYTYPQYSTDNPTYATGFNNDADSTKGPVWLRVIVPEPNAQVTIDDKATQQTGMDRLFVSPPVERNKDYTYTVKVRWTENGKEMTKEKQVQVRTDQANFVDFPSATRERQAEQPVRTDASDDRTPPVPDTITPVVPAGVPARAPSDAQTPSPNSNRRIQPKP